MMSDIIRRYPCKVCRQFKGEYVDEPQAMADKLRRNLLRDGLIVDVDVDPYEGATGDLPV